jgi:hypothetical protein
MFNNWFLNFVALIVYFRPLSELLLLIANVNSITFHTSFSTIPNILISLYNIIRRKKYLFVQIRIKFCYRV